MQVYTAVVRGQSDVNTVEAKLDLDPMVKADTILCQILIHILLVVELGGLWIEFHPNLGAKMGPLPSLSSTVAFPLPALLTTLDLLPFVIAKEMR